MAALSAQELFLAQLPFIERVVASTCRQHCLFGDEADDFKSFLHEKLIEDDYAVFRKFRGTSTLETYLVAVIQNRFRDFRIQRWGKWRPSAKAKRMGPLAVRLETLLSRDGLSLDQAVEVLQRTGAAPVSRREAAQLATQLPARPPRRMAGDGELAELPGSDQADERLLEHERRAGLERAEAALERALRTLPDEDRVIMRMRFQEGFTVAQISRALGLRQKPLYDRLDRNLLQLRKILESDAVTAQDIRELVV